MSEVYDLTPDEELVAHARDQRLGDIRAFSQLVERYQGRVQANCRHLTGSELDADDLTQEVFVKAYFALGAFEERSQFYTWLYRIKANHCINYNVAKRRRQHMHAAMPEHRTPESARVAATGVQDIVADERRERINKTLANLSETIRVPLMLRDADDLSYQEIADLLGLSLSAVKMRIKRGRQEFRDRYREVDVHNADSAITELATVPLPQDGQ